MCEEGEIAWRDEVGISFRIGVIGDLASSVSILLLSFV